MSNTRLCVGGPKHGEVLTAPDRAVPFTVMEDAPLPPTTDAAAAPNHVTYHARTIAYAGRTFRVWLTHPTVETDDIIASVLALIDADTSTVRAVEDAYAPAENFGCYTA